MKTRPSTRGVIDPITLTLIGLAVAGGLISVGSFHLPSFFHSKPPTVQLSTAQDELAKAKAAQAQAEAELADAKATQEAKTAQQLDYAQQMAAGTAIALSKVARDQFTPEVKLAAELSQRTIAGLEAARGKLPADAQIEIQHLIDQALQAKSAEVETLRSALAQKDATLQTTAQQKAELAAKIPLLEATVATAQAATAVKDATVQEKTKEVSVWAAAKAESDAKASSFDAQAGHLIRIMIGLGILYLIGHFMLPSLAQEYPGNGFLTGLNKTIKSIISSHV